MPTQADGTYTCPLCGAEMPEGPLSVCDNCEED